MLFSGIIGTILRPFTGYIRYAVLKVMKKMRAPDDKRPMIAASDHILNEILMPSVFRFFKEDEFRELANFKKLPISEHDRIFNELEVAAICLAVFYMRAIKSVVKPEDYHFWQGVEFHLPKQLQKTLMGYGVKGGNAKLMRQLIDLRRIEYEELSGEVSYANESEISRSEFKDLPSEMKHFTAAMQATAIGTTGHIRRGKMVKGNPLIRHLTFWLLGLQKKTSKFVKNL